MIRPIPSALTVPCPGEELFHASCAVFAYWWAPPDEQSFVSPGGFVGVLPPPALYAERLALSLRMGP